MNFTKGEWVADIRVGIVAVHVKDANKFNCLDGMRDECIYLAHGIRGKDGWEVSPEIVANANLIAAAPDTHKALKDLVEYLQKYGGVTPCLEDAIEALAKAEGGGK